MTRPEFLPRLNIIGAGRAGRTLVRAWHEAGVVNVGEVLNRSLASAQAACDFIGAGCAVASHAELKPADLWLLATQDGLLAEQAAWLATSGLLRAGDGVLHLSGFSSSALLAACAAQPGVRVASAHPVLSFATPERARTQLRGSLCGVEGDPHLSEQLQQLFASIGVECFGVSAANKPLYHAGSVFAANFLVVIIEQARQAYLAAGVPEAIAERLLAPLARNALDNVFTQGGATALTGPAARGDYDLIAAQHAAVSHWDELSGNTYKVLTEQALRLADRAKI